MLKQRDRVRTVGLTRDVSGAKGTLHPALAQTQSVQDVPLRLTWRGKKRSELLYREMASPQ